MHERERKSHDDSTVNIKHIMQSVKVEMRERQRRKRDGHVQQ